MEEGDFVSHRDERLRTRLTPNVVASYDLARVFSDNLTRVNSIDWATDGCSLVTSSDDDTVHIYNIETLHARHLYSRKYGVDLVQYVKGGTKSVVACAQRTSQEVGKGAIRLWDLGENRFLKTYSAPAPIIRFGGIRSHPAKDLLSVCCTDGSVRLLGIENFEAGATGRSRDTKNPSTVPWNIRMHAIFDGESLRPVAAFPRIGDFFACSIHPMTIDYYELRSTADCANGKLVAQVVLQGRFPTASGNVCEITDLMWNTDGQSVFVTIAFASTPPDADGCVTVETTILMVDMFSSRIIREFAFPPLEEFVPASRDLRRPASTGPWENLSSTSVEGFEVDTPADAVDPHVAALKALQEGSTVPGFHQQPPLESLKRHSLSRVNWGRLKHTERPPTGSPTVTPDGNFLACGAADGRIHIWSVTTGEIVRTLKGHKGFPRYTRFNPRNTLLASADHNVMLWLPTQTEN